MGGGDQIRGVVFPYNARPQGNPDPDHPPDPNPPSPQILGLDIVSQRVQTPQRSLTTMVLMNVSGQRRAA